MLIKCPECGKEVSENAVNCVHCGYPLNHKKEEVAKAEITKKKGERVVAFNTVLGFLGFMMFCGVLTSNGGIIGNQNATAISWFLTVGGTCAVLAIKKLNKIAAIICIIFFVISMLICSKSLAIAPAYLILELAIGINILLTIRYLKKNKVL